MLTETYNQCHIRLLKFTVNLANAYWYSRSIWNSRSISHTLSEIHSQSITCLLKSTINVTRLLKLTVNLIYAYQNSRSIPNTLTETHGQSRIRLLKTLFLLVSRKYAIARLVVGLGFPTKMSYNVFNHITCIWWRHHIGEDLNIIDK